jgi:hypothetical protein
MGTSKCHVRQLALLGSGHWLAISFAGSREPYIALIQALKTESYRNVYWHAGYWGNRQGAWIMAMFLVPRYVEYFDNLQAKLDEARAQKGLTI